MQQPSRPTVVVLCGADRPPGMAAVEQRAAVRYATGERLADELPGADVLFIWRTQSNALTRAWAKADGLRWVHSASAGTGQVLPGELIASDVLVTTSRGLFDEPIAEYVLGLVLAFAKDLPGRVRRQDDGTWHARETERVAGKTALIAGTGTIGRAIGRKLAAVGMRVSGIGRLGRPSDPDLGEVLPMDRLTDALRRTDYLVLAAPLTEDTRGMVNASTLAVMKPAARVINVSRGALVVHDDLVAALQRGRIAGAALDVFAEERPDESSPLWTMQNVLISPHMSGQVVGWRDELVALFVDNLIRYVEGRELRNVVHKSH
ncbi:MAG TPA: D-2-hydroxyacid dehydrogenase [Actinophytocola sp.]|uniref:D-2-hydroxyacid dehydrogenase n=1 Tax=Actinophytocola sp. TaxID=1872138 RepID=UPI002DDD9176|nr:D-2-hydroxyacid dehydrogenase [Actinophytocola sp.]HEV2781731.1 D-2-hydroxyacid dehydrogenase [Actinophytocola sp.]